LFIKDGEKEEVCGIFSIAHVIIVFFYLTTICFMEWKDLKKRSIFLLEIQINNLTLIFDSA